jgi:hypothetical protein
VLSAYRVTSLAEYPYANIQLYDMMNPGKQLCDYMIEDAGDCNVGKE